MLISGAEGIFTGLPGETMRATGAVRIVDGRIAAIGALVRRLNMCRDNGHAPAG
jgi:hypothetical protein